MGRVLDEIRDDPFMIWLTGVSESFGKAFQIVLKRWGRHIVHRNLVIAKVKNIGLKVALEKKFKDGKIMFLPDDFIAFPKGLLYQVENLVIKNGFAVKTMTKSSEKARKS